MQFERGSLVKIWGMTNVLF